MAPREVAGILVEHRAELHRCYHDIVAALPAARTDKCRIRRSRSCNDMRLRRKRDFYRSLTAIAERITEAHWSGPRFFGLTKRTRAVAGAKTSR